MTKICHWQSRDSGNGCCITAASHSKAGPSIPPRVNLTGRYAVMAFEGHDVGVGFAGYYCLPQAGPNDSARRECRTVERPAFFRLFPLSTSASHGVRQVKLKHEAHFTRYVPLPTTAELGPAAGDITPPLAETRLDSDRWHYNTVHVASTRYTLVPGSEAFIELMLVSCHRRGRSVLSCSAMPCGIMLKGSSCLEPVEPLTSTLLPLSSDPPLSLFASFPTFFVP